MPNVDGHQAIPYTRTELVAVRPVITRYNRPENPSRRLVATLDQTRAGVGEVRQKIAETITWLSTELQDEPAEAVADAMIAELRERRLSERLCALERGDSPPVQEVMRIRFWGEQDDDIIHQARLEARLMAVELRLGGDAA